MRAKAGSGRRNWEHQTALAKTRTEEEQDAAGGVQDMPLEGWDVIGTCHELDLLHGRPLREAGERWEFRPMGAPSTTDKPSSHARATARRARTTHKVRPGG